MDPIAFTSPSAPRELKTLHQVPLGTAKPREQLHTTRPPEQPRHITAPSKASTILLTNHREPKEAMLQEGITGPRAPTPFTLRGREQVQVSACCHRHAGTVGASQCCCNAQPHTAMPAEEPAHG